METIVVKQTIWFHRKIVTKKKKNKLRKISSCYDDEIQTKEIIFQALHNTSVFGIHTSTRYEERKKVTQWLTQLN